MKRIKILDISNYECTEDNEIIVGQGDNKHRVCSHTFQEYRKDDDGDEVEKEVWHTIVMVFNGSYKVGMADMTQYNANQSHFRNCFVPAYKAACKQIGITPIYQD